MILRDVSITSLRAAVDYMYNGEVRVSRSVNREMDNKYYIPTLDGN